MDWKRASDPPRLAPGEIHLWRIRLDRPAAALDADREVLSPDEIRRADRLRFPLHGRRLVAGRAALRRILGRYLDLPPSDVSFEYGPAGKPHLAGGGDDLRFNYSDSGDLAVCAVSRGREVGVDLERMRRDVEFLRLAERWFAPSEIVALRRTPETALPASFYACWTRKEAFVKALGGSIVRSTRRFSVTVDPAADEIGLAFPEDPEAADRWSLVSLRVAPGYAGALAIEGRAGPRRRMSWSD